MLNTAMIGNKIAEARKKINISQSQLAERLFISSQAVGKWERGESMPDITTFIRLAEILGVDLNYFSENFTSTLREKQAEEIPQHQEEESNVPLQRKKRSWNMSRANWVDADFSGLNTLQEKFSASNMKRCLFVKSELSGINLKANNIEDCDFSASDISKSQIQYSNLECNVFKGCSLQQAGFTASNIKACDFSGVDFTDAEFKFSSLEKNIFTDAVWNHTNFIGSQLENMEMEGNIDNCYFENCGFKKLTFSNACLINTFFKGKKLKGIKFIDCKADRITYEFLKSGKADLTGLVKIAE